MCGKNMVENAYLPKYHHLITIRGRDISNVMLLYTNSATFASVIKIMKSGYVSNLCLSSQLYSSSMSTFVSRDNVMFEDELCVHSGMTLNGFSSLRCCNIPRYSSIEIIFV